MKLKNAFALILSGLAMLALGLVNLTTLRAITGGRLAWALVGLGIAIAAYGAWSGSRRTTVVK